MTVTRRGATGVVTAVAAFIAAAALAGWIGPFRPGRRFGISANGASQVVGGAAWWLAFGLVVGLLAVNPSLVSGTIRAIRDAATGDRDRARNAAVAAVGGGLVAMFIPPAVAAAVAIALVATQLVPGRVGASSARVMMLAGLVAGLVVAAVLPRTTERVLAVIAAVLVAAWLVWRRTRAAPGVAAMLLLAGLAIGAVSSAHLGVVGAEQQQKATDVTVQGNRAFVPTGVTLTAGQVLEVTATGTVEVVGGRSASAVNPDGFPSRFSGCGGPGFCGVLVARIGGGAPFLIGSRYAAPASAAGKLELGVNDFDTSDNRGSFRASVSVRPASAAATLTQVGSFPPVTTGAGAIPSDHPSNAWVMLAGALAALGAVLGRWWAPTAAPRSADEIPTTAGVHDR